VNIQDIRSPEHNMKDLHDNDDRAPARVDVPVDGVEERLGDGLEEIFGQATWASQGMEQVDALTGSRKRDEPT
jgi:hypothetical protein